MRAAFAASREKQVPSTSKQIGIVIFLDCRRVDIILLQDSVVLVVASGGFEGKRRRRRRPKRSLWTDTSRHPLVPRHDLSLLEMSRAIVLDDSYAGFSYSAGQWTRPDTSARNYQSGDTFLQSLVDATYTQSTIPGATLNLTFNGKSISNILLQISQPAHPTRPRPTRTLAPTLWNPRTSVWILLGLTRCRNAHYNECLLFHQLLPLPALGGHKLEPSEARVGVDQLGLLGQRDRWKRRLDRFCGGANYDGGSRVRGSVA